MQLWLASTSPRRKALLETLGVPFRIIEPKFSEYPTDMTASEEALSFAEQKARSVAGPCQGGLIIGGDTLIDLAGQKIGKPRDPDDAVQILTKLSGQRHTVITAVVLLDTTDGKMRKYAGKTTVTFRPLSAEEIRRYVATGEAMGKAGAYAIQENGRRFVTKIDGDEDVVIGLPLRPIHRWLRNG